jgi:hypothetical protein
VISYAVSPTLPAGLTLNTTTGVISGTPTNTTAVANYTITATNNEGSTTALVSIAVTPSADNLFLSVPILTGFSSPAGSSSNSQSYTLSATILTTQGSDSTLSVVATSGYEVSKNNTSFGKTKTYTFVSGQPFNALVYVRKSASATGTAGQPFNGSVLHSGGGAIPQTLQLQGTM